MLHFDVSRAGFARHFQDTNRISEVAGCAWQLQQLQRFLKFQHLKRLLQNPAGWTALHMGILPALQLLQKRSELPKYSTFPEEMIQRCCGNLVSISYQHVATCT